MIFIITTDFDLPIIVYVPILYSIMYLPSDRIEINITINNKN